MNRGFYFDQSRCTGCHTCVIACKDWHEYELGVEPEDWVRVVTVERGRYPDISVTHLAMFCYHCLEAPCAKACPTGAVFKRQEDGIVAVERDLCLGRECSLCKEACPYAIPVFGKEGEDAVQKCDLCAERWAEGKKPICVEACPTRALDAGWIDELRSKYGDTRKAEGFSYSEEAGPCVTFRLKRPKKPAPGITGRSNK